MRRCKGQRICIICEGYEELEYIEALKSKAGFSDKYEFITVNAKSINTIIARYQEKYQSDSYSLVLVFCDTDRIPSEKYRMLKQKINEFHGRDVADEIVIFGNPCTMQIILSHFDKIRLTSQSKSVNSEYIEKYTGIKDYKATQEQRKILFNQISRSNYNTMKENIKKLSSNDEIISSSNFLKFIEKFESDEDSWIDEINSD
jgi:hypothetical protein